jgi:hypothetical protein
MILNEKLVQREHFYVHTMKGKKGSGGIAPLTHNLSTVWRWLALFTVGKFISTEIKPPVPVEKKTG